MLLGQFEAQVIGGNRVAVPKKFREELGSNLVVAKWYENCLVLVSSKQWTKLLARLTGKSEMITQTVREIDRFILGSAFEMNTDSQGRVVLPPSLVSFAGLDDKVVFLGLGDRVEIWNKNNWLKQEKEVAGKSAEMIEKLAEESRNSHA